MGGGGWSDIGVVAGEGCGGVGLECGELYEESSAGNEAGLEGEWCVGVDAAVADNADSGRLPDVFKLPDERHADGGAADAFGEGFFEVFAGDDACGGLCESSGREAEGDAGEHAEQREDFESGQLPHGGRSCRRVMEGVGEQR